MLITIAVVFVLILISGFFAASETALTATSRSLMFQLEQEGDRRAAKVNKLLKRRERLISTILFGNTTINIDKTNLVGLLNELESDGLVERRRSAEDRRRHSVVITANGAKKLADFEAILVDVEKRVLANLSDAQRSTWSRSSVATSASSVSRVASRCEPPAASKRRRALRIRSRRCALRVASQPSRV